VPPRPGPAAPAAQQQKTEGAPESEAARKNRKIGFV